MDEMQIKTWRARSDLRSKIMNDFWAWGDKGEPEPMPRALALATMTDGIDLCESMVERLMQRNDPELISKHLDIWIQGIEEVKSNLSGRIAPKLSSSSDANLAGAIAKGFGARMAELAVNTYVERPKLAASMLAWMDRMPSLMATGFKLESLLKLDGLAGGLPERFAKAALCAIREPGLDSAWIAKAWIMAGADPLAPAIVDRGWQGRLGIQGEPAASSWMDAILGGQPSAWLFASFLCEAGASIGRDKWGAGRQLMNCAFAERAGKLKGVSSELRLGAVFAILSGMGLDVKEYRGKGGEMFDEFALGALWANPSKELVDGLKDMGVSFKNRSKQKMGFIAAKRLDADRHGMGRPTMEAIEAVSSGLGVGPFNKGWSSLARVACSMWHSDWQQDLNSKDWGELFAILARDSGWSAFDISEIEAAHPRWSGQPALMAAKEAAELRGSVSEPVIPAKRSLSL